MSKETRERSEMKMLHNFLIFVAPFIIIIAAIVIVFWSAPQDESVTKEK